MNTKLLIAALALPLFAVACDGPTDPATQAPSKVTVQFSKATSSASKSLSAAESASTTPVLSVQGSNGTLAITDIRFIVAELELKCAKDTAAPVCAKFSAPPSFVQLPLGTGAFEVTTAEIPLGTYSKFEFEVEDLEGDVDDDAQKKTHLQELFTKIRQAFPDFPATASLVVDGTFTPAGTSTAQPFRVYFDAEIEVELDLSPALEVTGTGASRALTVNVMPEAWFKKADGTVLDLSALNYASREEGQDLPSLEVEIQNGFHGVEVD